MIVSRFSLVACIFLLAACSWRPDDKMPLPAPTLVLRPLDVTVPAVPGTDRSTITGFLLENPSAPRPVAGAVLYLGDIVNSADGRPSIASFDRTSRLHTQTDNYGRFVFTNVPPQRYTLILDRINVAYLLKNPKDNSDFTFDAKAGEIVSLGDLVYPQLPGY